jgi:hypothetical protein
MKINFLAFRSAAARMALSAVALFALGALAAQAASVSGTVTNKTTGKPSAGDVVVLVEPMSGMSEVGRASSDAKGHYTLALPGTNPYLIRVTHQGAEYFVSVPQGGGAADASVYDVAAKVQGVSIEADVLEVEAQNGQLSVNERFFVHNTSTPPTTQWTKKSFEVVLPADATVSETQGQRPGGLPTTLKVEPTGQKGHFTFNFPIQPDDGEKSTLFQVSYTVPYSSGSYTFHSAVTLPAESFAVLMPKSMTLAAAAGSEMKSVQADPGIQTWLLKKAQPGKVITFTLSGNGAIPRDDQSQSQSQQGGMGQQGQGPVANGQPGGGIGAPIESPDPLSKYKWWILGVLALLMAGGAAFMLRAPAGAAQAYAGTAVAVPQIPVPAGGALLAALKEELFRLESDKVSGLITAAEYAEVKAALEIVLKRALNHK